MPFSISSVDLDKRLVEEKVEHNIKEEINFLKTSAFGTDSLRRDEYEIQVKKAEAHVKASRCKRTLKKLTKINDLLSEQSKKLGGFLEIFTQGISLQAHYFCRALLTDRGVQVLIMNNSDFEKYLSEDFRKKMKIIEISKESCYLSEMGVKYFHSIPGFSEDPIFGYFF